MILAYAWIYLMYFAAAMGFGPAISTINDLVLPRTRAITMAFNNMLIILIASGLAPYFIGQISDVIAATGVDSAESLRQGLLWSLLIAVTSIVFIILAIRHIEADKTSLQERARALGEEI